MPSASVGEENASLFEPIHGSYPEAAGQNVANPCGDNTFCCNYKNDTFKLKEEAKLIRDVVNLSLEKLIVTEDLSNGNKSFSTSEVGTWLSKKILE